MIEEFKSDLEGSFRYHASRAFRQVWMPNRSENLDAASFFTSNPDTLLYTLFNGRAKVSSDSLPQMGGGQFPIQWRADEGELRFLSGFIHSVRPGKMLETGIADGASSRIILDAMEENGAGLLWSTDISGDAGDLAVLSRGVARWRPRILSPRGRAKQFRQILKEVSPLDVFLHDSDHRYSWQSLEYREGWDALKPGGYLLSDDICSSYAFIDFCSERKLKPDVLIGQRKLFGVVQKTG